MNSIFINLNRYADVPNSTPTLIPIQIVGSGACQPERKVDSTEIDQKMGYKSGLTERITGVKSRFYATNESATDLATMAIDIALQSSKLKIGDIDCVISASGTMEQAIPYNAVKLHKSLGLSSNVVTFDINMTCLGALMAIDMAASLIQTGRYENILIYASEIISVGVDWKNIETGGLFGDGAAALIVTKPKSVTGSSRIIASLIRLRILSYPSSKNDYRNIS